KWKFLSNSKLTFADPPPPVMELVVPGVVSVLNTLKLRTNPTISTCKLRSPTFVSQALFTTTSGCRFGTAGFVPALAALVLPLPLSNWLLNDGEGNVTEDGTNCWGFSSDTPIAQEFAAGWG